MGRDVHCPHPSDMSVVAPFPGGVDIDMSATGSYRKANGEDLPQGRVGSADGPGALDFQSTRRAPRAGLKSPNLSS